MTTVLRYHSCYPWHNKGDYDRFMAPGDEKLKEVLIFLALFRSRFPSFFHICFASFPPIFR